MVIMTGIFSFSLMRGVATIFASMIPLHIYLAMNLRVNAMGKLCQLALMNYPSEY